MIKIIISAATALILSSAINVSLVVAAPGPSTVKSAKPKRPPVKPNAPRVYKENAYKSGLAARQMREARRRTGKSLSKPKSKVRGAGSRGGGIKPRAEVPGRNASSGRGTRGSGARAATSRPWSYYNRRPKKVTKRRKDGKQVTFKSSKPAKKPAPRQRRQVVSERLGRVQLDGNGNAPQFTKGGPNNAGNFLQYQRALDAPRAIQSLTPATPRAQREAGKVTKWGRIKKLFSSKQKKSS